MPKEICHFFHVYWAGRNKGGFPHSWDWKEAQFSSGARYPTQPPGLLKALPVQPQQATPEREAGRGDGKTSWQHLDWLSQEGGLGHRVF